MDVRIRRREGKRGKRKEGRNEGKKDGFKEHGGRGALADGGTRKTTLWASEAGRDSGLDWWVNRMVRKDKGTTGKKEESERERIAVDAVEGFVKRFWRRCCEKEREAGGMNELRWNE